MIHLPGYGGSHFMTRCGKLYKKISYMSKDVNCQICLRLEKENSYRDKNKTFTEKEYEERIRSRKF